MAILLSTNIAQCDHRARPRGMTTARRSVGLGLVEILSWMRHCLALGLRVKAMPHDNDLCNDIVDDEIQRLMIIDIIQPKDVNL